jgi:hypothetical protein
MNKVLVVFSSHFMYIIIIIISLLQYILKIDLFSLIIEKYKLNSNDNWTFAIKSKSKK